MYKYLVTWCIINLVPCSRTTVDEFGRSSNLNTLEYCVETIYDCNHSKEFGNRKEAFDFYNRAKKESVDSAYINYNGYLSNDKLCNVAIDSLKIE